MAMTLRVMSSCLCAVYVTTLQLTYTGSVHKCSISLVAVTVLRLSFQNGTILCSLDVISFVHSAFCSN